MPIPSRYRSTHGWYKRSALRWYQGTAPIDEYASLWLYDEGILQWHVDLAALDPPGVYNSDASLLVRSSGDIWVLNRNTGDHHPRVYKIDSTDGSLLAYWEGDFEVESGIRLALDDTTGSIWIGYTIDGSLWGERLNDDCESVAVTDEYTGMGSFSFQASGGYLYLTDNRSGTSFFKIDEDGNEVDSATKYNYSGHRTYPANGRYWIHEGLQQWVRHYAHYDDAPFTSWTRMYFAPYGGSSSDWDDIEFSQALTRHGGNLIVTFFPAYSGQTNRFEYVDLSEEGFISGTYDGMWVHSVTGEAARIRAGAVDATQIAMAIEYDDSNMCEVLDHTATPTYDFEVEHELPLGIHRFGINGTQVAMLTQRAIVP